MRVVSIVRAAAWTGVLAGCVLFALNAADLIRHDVAGDYVEGVVLTAQLAIRDGISPYDPHGWAAPPYDINLYGPVAYHLGAWALSGSDGVVTLGPGRVVSLIALLLTVALVWQLGRSALRLSSSESLFGSLLPLGFVPVLIFAPQNRVDVIGVLASIAGVVAAYHARRIGWVAAGAIFTIGVFTKPTAIAAPLAVAIWLVTRRRWRDLGLLAASCVAIGLAWLVWLHIATGGGFTTSVFGFNGANPFAVGGLVKALQTVFAAAYLPLAAAIAATLLIEGDEGERLVSLYALLALALAVATVGKVGANVNYFVEPAMAFAPVAGLAWKRWGATLAGAAAATAVAASLLLWAAPRVAWELRGRAERQHVDRELAPVMRGRSVLTMEVFSALRAGGKPYLNDPCIFACLANAGRWNQERLLSDLRSHAIDVVLADADLSVARPEFSNWSPEVRRAVADNYSLSRVLGRNLYLYLPRTEDR